MEEDTTVPEEEDDSAPKEEMDDYETADGSGHVCVKDRSRSKTQQLCREAKFRWQTPDEYPVHRQSKTQKLTKMKTKSLKKQPGSKVDSDSFFGKVLYDLVYRFCFVASQEKLQSSISTTALCCQENSLAGRDPYL